MNSRTNRRLLELGHVAHAGKHDQPRIRQVLDQPDPEPGRHQAVLVAEHHQRRVGDPAERRVEGIRPLRHDLAERGEEGHAGHRLAIDPDELPRSHRVAGGR